MCSGPVSAGHKGTLDECLGLQDHPNANVGTTPFSTSEAAFKTVGFVPLLWWQRKR